MSKKVKKGINDLETLYPNLILDWDYQKNKKNPDEYFSHGRQKVAWKCHCCGYEWMAYIYRRTAGNGCPACAGQVLIVGKNDLKTKAPELAKQWDYSKNGDLRPENVMLNSSKPVYWICEKGHSWCVSPNSRVSQHTGCRQCSSELRTSFAEQAILFYVRKYVDAENRYMFNGKEIDIYIPTLKIGIEYDGIYYHSGQAAKEREKKKNELCQKNGIELLRIKEVRKKEQVPISTDKIFYRYVEREEYLEEAIKWVIEHIKEKGNYTYGISINLSNDRRYIRELYVKSEKQASLKLRCPNLILEWDFEKNGNLKPENFTYGSDVKVWWKCPKGHSYEASISHRTQKVNATSCPYCAGQQIMSGYNDLATKRPDLMQEWDYEKNVGINPKSISANNTAKKVWWICPKGHSYEATPHKRNNGRNCPYCSGKRALIGYNDLASQRPDIAIDWDYKENGNLKPTEVVCGCNKIVNWKCHNCGYEWKAQINQRTKGRAKCKECKIKK